MGSDRGAAIGGSDARLEEGAMLTKRKRDKMQLQEASKERLCIYIRMYCTMYNVVQCTMYTSGAVIDGMVGSPWDNSGLEAIWTTQRIVSRQNMSRIGQKRGNWGKVEDVWLGVVNCRWH